MKIKYILFDVDNTLLDFSKCSEFALKSAFECNNIPFSSDAENAFHKVNSALWKRVEKGEIDRYELYKIRFSLVFDELGIKGDFESVENDFRKFIGESSFLIDGAEEILSYLYKNYTLCVASNAMLSQQKHRLEKAGLSKFFTDFFTSAEIGAEKPSEMFFEKCQEDLNCEKEEMLLIGDSLTADIKGATDFGIKSCWYNPSFSDNPYDFSADYTVDSLLKIKELL